MRVLCVAEKPSIAKSITQILSGGRFETRQTRNRYIRNYDFHYPQTNSTFTVTSVSGHLMNYNFPEAYSSWTSCDPLILFDVPVESKVSAEFESIERNLMAEARTANTLMIWTDCDREGENIGNEVAQVCRKARPNIVVKRARFSAIITQPIHYAAQNPIELDILQSDAVEARTILDLRIGAAFTRMQSLALQARFQQMKNKREPVSYGPCQFPTLGFVVARYNQVKAFVPETFWYISLSITHRASGENKETVFKWQRGHLFEFEVASAIFDGVRAAARARVTKVTKKNTKKWKPLPLTTVELQKAGSRLLRMAPKKVLDVAEKLYQRGFLSYPRTETDQFDSHFNFDLLLEKQAIDPAWGAFATSLRRGGFQAPRKGSHNDRAHPPIHPTAHAANLVGDESKVYEYITRRFLASCSKDAEGSETIVDVELGGEKFHATGLIIFQRNYLEVYPYDKWAAKEIPNFVEGEEYNPTVCELQDGQTTSPSLLTEADLVGLMDKNGIGTDATIAQHIQTIIDREYVIERMEGTTKYLLPSTLGIGLIDGYNEIGFDRSLGKPQLRRETERSMVQVCRGEKEKVDMLNESIAQYKEMFVIARREFNKVIDSVARYVEGGGQRGRGAGPDGGRGGGGGAQGGNNRGDSDSDDENPGDGRGEGGGGVRRGGRGGAPNSRGGAPNSRGGAPNSRGGGRGTSATNASSSAQPRRRAQAPSTAHPGYDSDDDAHEIRPAPPLSRSASRSTSMKRSRTEGSSRGYGTTGTNCYCNVPASLTKLSQKASKKDSHFYSCGKDNSCGYFQWAGDVAPPPKSSGPSSSRRAPPEHSAGNNAPTPQCDCGQDAVRRTVWREGTNKGRLFWNCSLSPQGCGFYQWDTLPRNDVATPVSPNTINALSGPPPSGKCYKCDREGHWSSNCPYASRVRESNTNAGPDTCYSCGEPGHLYSACPNASASKKSRGTSNEPCYGCGQIGHWRSECPAQKRPDDDLPQPKPREKKATARKSTSSSKGTRVSKGTKSSKKKTKNNTFGAPDDF